MARCFYQLLISELSSARAAGHAYEWILDAARRTRDEQPVPPGAPTSPCRPAPANRRWRPPRLAPGGARVDGRAAHAVADPVLLNRPDLAEPLRALLVMTPRSRPAGPDRVAAALPAARQTTARQRPNWSKTVLRPYLKAPATRVAARVAMGRAWAQRRRRRPGLVLAQEAQVLDPHRARPRAAGTGTDARASGRRGHRCSTTCARAPPNPALRMVYVRTLTAASVTPTPWCNWNAPRADKPDLSQPFLTLGALHLELRSPGRRGRPAALPRPVQAARPPPSRPPATDDDDDDDDDRPGQGRCRPG
jgi:hypothetical protein